MIHTRQFLVALLLGSVALGCGGAKKDAPKTVPVSGTVTVDGQPIGGATVTFLPTSTDRHGATGTTDATGRYTLFVGDNRGAMPGNYKVTIQYFVKKDGTPFIVTPETDMETVQGEIKPALPAKYSDPEKTELTTTVPDKGTDKADFKLETGAPPA